MRSVQRFSSARPLAFAILATMAWILVTGVAALISAWALHRPLTTDVLPQSLGTLAATACLLVIMARWGWLRAAGITALGSWRLWMVTAGLAVYGIVAYQFAFFGKIALDLSASWHSGVAQPILRRQVVVGIVEETLFRGFLLYALVRVWGNSRRGLLAAIAVPALLFGLPHAGQVLAGNPVDDTLMTMLNCFVAGVWFGALVLLGGSLWPAVLIHAVSNACYQITALSSGGISPTAADYAIATASELPMVFAGLWLLLRKAPGSFPARRGEWGAKASMSASTILRLLLLFSLAGTLFLAGCAGQMASSSTHTAHPPAAIPTRLSAAERAAILDAAWQTVDDEYFDPTFGGADWQAIGDEYRQKLATVQDDDTFWRQVVNPMLFELGVSHLAALPAELANQLEPVTFATGSLGMDVGYLRLSSFTTPVLDSALQALDDLRDAPALIIDLRGNPGGGFPVRKAIASHLVGEPKLFMRYQRRDGLEEALTYLQGGREGG